MKHRHWILAGLALFAGLTFTPNADAQILWRWFGPKTPDKAPPAAKAPPVVDPRRVTEINVEVAWLADSVTFPYYLEARTAGSQLEVRGYVPNRAVRDHAVKIAQVHSSMPVIDSMKEHPSLLVRPGQMSPQQLQNSAQSSLRVVLPKQHQQLKVDVSPDGKVFVMGPVNSYEEKIAVSHALRRLHGCTSVQNLTLLPAELAQRPPSVAEKPLPSFAPIVKTSNSPAEPKTDKAPMREEAKTKPWQWPFGKGPAVGKLEPPQPNPKRPNPLEAPVDGKKPSTLDPPIVVVSQAKPPEVVKDDMPPPVPKTPALSTAELQKRVKAAWPDAKSVAVDFTSERELRIILEIRDEKELAPAAERVFALPELQDARVDLQFKISGP